MRYFFIVAGLGFLCLPCQVLAQDWSFSPEIYARGGVTYKSDFSKEAGFGDGREKAFNLGPYNEESLIASPLTEVTVHANYGDSFRFHYGVNVSGNRQFQYSDEKSPTSRSFVAERLAYGEFRASQGMSFWYGHRPFRSPPEFLSRAFLFDEINLSGGGLRLEGLGPLSIDFAYGSFVNEYVSGVQAQEFTNVFINKTEFSLNNSAFKTNLEIQQTKKTFANEQNQDSTAGIIAGLAYQRWGDEVFGAKLYNQLVLQSSKGYVAKTIMASAFSSDAFDSSKEPSKILVSWNGDWKAKQYGFYWLALFQDHMGKNPQFAKSEMVWQTLDGMLRPIYAVTPNITLGFELDRRSILKEGEGLRQNANSGTSDWATNGGATRWGGILSYNLDNKMFDYPSIGLYAGEIIKDRATSFFTSEPEARSTHFVRLYYEVKIN